MDEQNAGKNVPADSTEYKALRLAVIEGDIPAAVAETNRLADAGLPAAGIIEQGLTPAMDEVGEKFASGEYFIPQMLLSARTMQECMKYLEPHLKAGEKTSKGLVLIGTVQGDLHDIGKNLVAVMLEGSGFTVIDLGVDVPPDKFVLKAQELNPDIIAMSALLTTTMPAMAKTIQALDTAGIRDKARIMIGGAPVTQDYATEIKADLFAPDAGAAVIKAKAALGVD